jgi:hypothetical protein
MFPRLMNRLIGHLLGHILGMTGRASRLDLDSGAARDFIAAPSGQASNKPLLRVIEGGRQSAKPVGPTSGRPQPTARRHG